MLKLRCITLIALVFVFLSQAGAVTMDSNSWEGRYEANALPSAENSHWFNTGWGTNWQTASSVSNGILNINTSALPGAVHLWRWGYPGPGMNFANGATIEFRARVNSWMPSGVSEGSTCLQIWDTSGRAAWFELTNSAFVISGGGTATLNTTNGFHTYRIVFEDATNITVYYDGDFNNPVTQTIRTLAWDNSDSDVLYFGNYYGQANWDIDYVRWTNQGRLPSAVPTYISDMSQCLPASALSTTVAQNKWVLIPYEAANGITGKMAGASSFIDAPDLTIPLNVSGWYDIYICYWTPGFDYGSTSTLFKVKLSGETGFRPIVDYDFGHTDTHDASYLKEVYFDHEDLTGRNLVIGTPFGAGYEAKKVFLAYVKLVPLAQAKAQQIIADRARTDTKKLWSLIDGSSYFWIEGINKPEDVLVEIALYKHSDVEKIIWGIAGGSGVGFPTDVNDAVWYGSGDPNYFECVTGGNNGGYPWGSKQLHESLRTLWYDYNTFPQKDAADLAHSMGIKFDVIFRMGILGWIPSDPNAFVARHLDCRQVLQNGTVLHKASYAYQQSRQFMFDLIRDAAERVDVDGVMLSFVGPHFVCSEQPVADRLLSVYGKNIAAVSPTDPDLYACRAYFMTQLISGVRAVLNEVGTAKGKTLTLGILVWPHDQNGWNGGTTAAEGLDVVNWIHAGYLESVICVSNNEIDTLFKSECESHGVKYVAGRTILDPGSITNWYNNGIQRFAIWDMDGWQYYPYYWSWLSRAGHQDEMASWESSDYVNEALIKLNKISGVDIREGLADSVYSGM